MPRTTITLAICILAGCLLLAARTVIRTSAEKPTSPTAVEAVSESARAEPASEEAGAEEAPEIAEDQPPSEESDLPPAGPILLPLNPPYLSRPVVDHAQAPGVEGPPQEDFSGQEALLREAEEPPLTSEEERPESPAEEASGEQPSEATQPETPAPKEPEPKRELTPAQVALRDRIRRTLTLNHRQLLSARENTAAELMHACLAFGCNTEVYRSDSSRRKINGITCLCWNYPCAGYEPLVLSEGRIAARIGYGCQEHPSQLLAVLALSRVKSTYPLRVGEEVRSVADLVEYEKLSCRSGSDLSLRLIGLSYYVGDDATWKNGLGENWSIQRIIKEELAQPVVTAAAGGTHRLMGLSYAVDRRAKRKQPIDGQFRRAEKFIREFHGYALRLQNSDGSWSPLFFAAKGTSRNQAAQLRSTGHVLEWLAMSLPEDRLDDPRVVRSVEYVDRLLGSSRYGRNVKSLSTREIGAVMHALHGLVVYDQRLFRPADPKPPAEEVVKQAAR